MQAHRQRPAALPEAAAAAPGAAAAGLASLHSQPSGTSCPAAVAGPVSAPLPARLFHRPGCTPRSRRLAPAVAAHSAADAHDTAAAPAPLQTQSDKQQQQHQQQHHHQQQHVSGVAAAAGMQEQEQHSPLEAPRAQQQAGSAQPPAAGPGKQGGQEEHEAKELNKAICAAQSHNDLLGLVGARLTDFSLVNAVTAFHRLAKVGAAASPCRWVLLQHPREVGCWQPGWLLAKWLLVAGWAWLAADVPSLHVRVLGWGWLRCLWCALPCAGWSQDSCAVLSPTSIPLLAAPSRPCSTRQASGGHSKQLSSGTR